jgi:hypothetical protein
MSLPNLPDLDSLDTTKQSHKASVKKEESRQSKKKKEPKELRIPKSRYDEDGNPILTIPDLDDVNLNGEIDKYFGEKGGDK